MRLRDLVRRPLLLIASGFVAALAAGCAPNTDNQQIQADQFTLRRMVADDQQQIDSLQEKIQRLEDHVSELEHNGSGSSGGGNQLSSIENRLNKLESQTNSKAGAASAPPAAAASPAGANPEAPGASEAAPETGSAEGPGTGEEGAPGGEAATTPPNTKSATLAAIAPDTGSAAPAANAPNTESTAPAANAPSWRAMMDQELASTHDDPGEKLYRAGLVQLKANNYSKALGQLQTLQRRYPKSSLSEPAEFFAANALYEMGKYDQAILQFNDQTMRFPKGRFASAALLREAQAFMKINDRIDARLTLQKLLSDLPDSAEAPMAKAMMQTLAS
ncbi:MAG: outer membrane protein assembly factor BamD [Deltaproteobacteria bacterium]|nr:outer membrane protein assembly factor BamD [Deltaproteobacteria bacterium]